MSVLLVGIGTRTVAAFKANALQERASATTEVRAVDGRAAQALLSPVIIAAHLEAEEVEEREVQHRNTLLRTDLPTAAHVPLDLATTVERSGRAVRSLCPPLRGTCPPRGPLALLQVFRL